MHKIFNLLKQLDSLLTNNNNLTRIYADDLNELRKNVRKLLIDFNTNIQQLKNIEQEDAFKTNPIYATQRFQIIRNIETAKVDLEFDLAPVVEKITKQLIQLAKQNPSNSLDVNSLPPLETGDKWTVEKVINISEQFVDKATKAVGIVSKFYPLVKALGLIAGVSIP
jgi:hypothetical protein